ncbi:hypothetical protein AWB67_07455 [Caballeronia terrestris]|uniref:Uncharacterized protein n=1 Tax=Caballeronia terrestris TaxID=1226301 RepID=A0A158L2V1_9BURK|nr:hypothetical protein AWB67_07455 [Caballeronia terrestris]
MLTMPMFEAVGELPVGFHAHRWNLCNTLRDEYPVPKSVHRDAHPKRADLIESLKRRSCVVEQGGFGDHEFETLRG